jgi:hypothetical protein
VFFPSQRTPLNNTLHSQETDINSPAGFESAIPEWDQPQTHTLDREATEIGKLDALYIVYSVHYDKVNNSCNTNKCTILELMRTFYYISHTCFNTIIPPSSGIWQQKFFQRRAYVCWHYNICMFIVTHYTAVSSKPVCLQLPKDGNNSAETCIS